MYKGVSSVFYYSVEGKEEEEQFDAALEMTLRPNSQRAHGNSFAVFKPTVLVVLSCMKN
jgi:proline dehydrogenase